MYPVTNRAAKPRGANRFHHKQSKVATRTSPQTQGYQRGLCSRVNPPGIREAFANGVAERHKHLAGINPSCPAYELLRPLADFVTIVWIMALHCPRQIRGFIVVVTERVFQSRFIDLKVGRVLRRMVQANPRFEPQLFWQRS